MKRTGRPPLPVEQKRVRVSVLIAPDVYDAIYRAAQRRGEAVHAVLCKILTSAVSVSKKTPPTT